MSEQPPSLEKWAQDHFDWKGYELKLAELFERRSTDAQKLSTEFSKLIITNLIVLNAGGLVSIAPISAFFGLNGSTWHERLGIFGVPACFYVAGLLLGMFCSLGTYYNYQMHAHLALTHSELAILEARVERSLITENPKWHSELVAQRPTIQDTSASIVSKIRWTFIGSHIIGWASLLCFLAGSLIIAWRAPSL
ncbi:hypothetical protein [Beijerinckia sp. L45]|uniref:hypothetical protein n=1 Tax=Beijerinckia sp. L45 TaxID=1641855 RepID=UPI00131A612C|nr:hypothetical protein [Beijerinckia sp. L45]